jgi:hypothetical protein
MTLIGGPWKWLLLRRGRSPPRSPLEVLMKSVPSVVTPALVDRLDDALRDGAKAVIKSSQTLARDGSAS